MQKKLDLGAKRHCEEIIPFYTHSTGNLPHLPILKKSIFPGKNHLLFRKIQILYVFGISYCFIRILPQISYNLVRKNCLPKSCNWQINVKKNARGESKIFLRYYKYRRKILISKAFFIAINNLFVSFH